MDATRHASTIIQLEHAAQLEPDRADLHGRLAIALARQGRLDEAVARFRQVTVLRPDSAEAHNDLGNALRLLGRLEEAIACFGQALRLRADCVEALLNLGLARAARGEWSEAADAYRRALALRPDDPGAHHLMGMALAAQGEHESAIAHYQAAVQLRPDFAEAHACLGRAAQRLGRMDEAIAHDQAVVRLRPGSADAHNNLGSALRARNRLDEAKACFAEALRLDPSQSLSYSNIGQVLKEEGRLNEALAWHDRGLALAPGLATLHANRAGVLEEQERYREALAGYEQALRLDPNHAEAHHGIGRVRHLQGQFQEALRSYQEVLRLRPDFELAHCSLGTLLQELGDNDAALRSYREALRHHPDHVGAHVQLASLLRARVPDADLHTMQRLAVDPALTDSKRAALHFGLAQVLDARGDYTSAAEHLRLANTLALSDRRKRGGSYIPADHEQLIDRLIAAFTPAYFERVRGWGVESERPVFIVGLPRSGTTLTEQILASHSQVFGAGELGFAREAFESLPAAINQSVLRPVDCVPHLNPAIVAQTARAYLARLDELNNEAPRIVDKMPENYHFLGLLATLFPRARFIRCRRDMRDIAVSCWMTNFREVDWASDPDHIVSRFRCYHRLMEHWLAVLPVPLFELDYEELVADPENTARRLVAWCGLDWEPTCLSFHEARRPVRTASATQVRRPIYRDSVARWRHYEPALGPLFARLRETM